MDDTQRQGIRERMPWFGEVLLASASEPGDPARNRLTQRSMAFFAGMTLLFLGAVLAAIAGSVLLLLALIRRRQNRFPSAFHPWSDRADLFLEAFAVYLGLVCLADLAAALLSRGRELPVIATVAAVAVPSILGVCWPLLRGLSWRETAGSLGFHRGRGILREIGCGVIGYIGILPLVATGMVISLALMGLWNLGEEMVRHLAGESGADPVQTPMSHPAVEWMAEGNVTTRLLVLGLAAGFAPLFEELLFRGALLRGLRSRRGLLRSGVVMGFIFAIIHPQGLAAVPVLMALGFGFGLLREWRDSLIASMTGHALHNGTLVLLMWLAFSL